jgi:hypothetical protein
VESVCKACTCRAGCETQPTARNQHPRKFPSIARLSLHHSESACLRSIGWRRIKRLSGRALVALAGTFPRQRPRKAAPDGRLDPFRAESVRHAMLHEVRTARHHAWTGRPGPRTGPRS